MSTIYAEDKNLPEDDMRYNRQLFVLGDISLRKLVRSSVLLSGFGSLGLEVAKNLVMAGVGQLVIHDATITSKADVETNFFLNEKALGQKRALASLQHLKDLNPRVDIRVIEDTIDARNPAFLKDFQCVIFTEAELRDSMMINEFCRAHIPPIKFIMADAFGPLCWTFCDFGPSHIVLDSDGEAPKKDLIVHITDSDPVTVTLASKRHGFESGDIVILDEVNEHCPYHGVPLRITMLSGESFQFEYYHAEDLLLVKSSSSSLSPSTRSAYLGGGICLQVKLSNSLTQCSLESQLRAPNIASILDGQMSAVCHLMMLTLHSFSETHKRLPAPWSEEDAKLFVAEAERIKINFGIQLEIDSGLFSKMAFTSSGVLPPLAAFLGGVVAHEAIKAITCKFTPIDQWFYFDAFDVIPEGNSIRQNSNAGNSSWNPLAVCVGHPVVSFLQSMNIFMAGCGAIGCEALKNLALLNVGIGTGLVIVTDDDVVTKSNLGSQFLFKESSIKESKTSEAALTLRAFRPDMKIEAMNLNVGPHNVDTHFNGAFLESQSLVVGALDNVDGRRLLDSCCIRAQRPFLDSGTWGTKGHVQVVLPHCTESYSCKMDPIDSSEDDIPYCMVKSFPSCIEHAVVWARDKFDSLFNAKPSEAKKFYDMSRAIKPFFAGDQIDETILSKYKISSDMLRDVCYMANFPSIKWRPKTWTDCVTTARLKFHKYFSTKAKQLLFNFPLDLLTESGAPFWHPPRRIPRPIEFDHHNETHLEFVLATSRLYAQVNNIPYTQEECSPEKLTQILELVTVPEFVPNTTKFVETDENVMPWMITDEKMSATDEPSLDYVKSIVKKDYNAIEPVTFDKDDVSKAHLDFVFAASKLRGSMYNLKPIDKNATRRLSGKIIPAMVTTTSAVAGLLALEVLRLAKGQSREQHRNSFINLANPLFVFSQPAPAAVINLRADLDITLWDRWELSGQNSFTLKDFISALKDKYDVDVTMVTKGSQIIFLPILPGHNKRLSQRMDHLVPVPPQKPIVELSIVVETMDGDERSGPPVLYTFA